MYAFLGSYATVYGHARLVLFTIHGCGGSFCLGVIFSFLRGVLARLLISILTLFNKAVLVVGVVNCAASLGGRPDDAVDDMFMVTKHLDDRVIVVMVCVLSCPRSFLTHHITIPNYDAFIFASTRK